MSAIAVVLAERPIVMPLAALVEKQNWGLLRLFRLPLWLEIAAALVLMDYAFYVWHVLMHRVPLLWRFHLVHHVDLDLDASTALRFHFTEMLASIPWRAGQVVLIGLTPFSFSIWQCVFLVSHPLPPFQCRTADPMGAAAEQARRDAPDARNSPFDCGAGNEFQLVKRPDGLGLAARNPSAERAASGDHDWRSGVSRAEGRHVAHEFSPCLLNTCRRVGHSRVTARRSASSRQKLHKRALLP